MRVEPTRSALDCGEANSTSRQPKSVTGKGAGASQGQGQHLPGLSFNDPLELFET
jgi:hypothetical protein